MKNSRCCQLWKIFFSFNQEALFQAILSNTNSWNGFGLGLLFQSARQPELKADSILDRIVAYGVKMCFYIKTLKNCEKRARQPHEPMFPAQLLQPAPSARLTSLDAALGSRFVARTPSSAPPPALTPVPTRDSLLAMEHTPPFVPPVSWTSVCPACKLNLRLSRSCVKPPCVAPLSWTSVCPACELNLRCLSS